MPFEPLDEPSCFIWRKSLVQRCWFVYGAVESSMTHISGHDHSQMLLLPETVDDYVDADNPVRFIDAFVVAATGFVRVEPKATGRPAMRQPIS